MNINSALLGQLAWTQIWQVAAVVTAVTLVTRVRAVRQRPYLAYALWLLVLAKSLTPPLVASPTSPFSWALAETNARPDSMENDAAPTVADAGAMAAAAVPIVEPQSIEPGLPLNSEPIHAPADVPVVELSERALPLGQAAANWMTLGMALFALWAIGAAAYASVALLRLRRICRRLAHDGQRETTSVDGVVTELARALGLRKSPHVIFTPQPFGPALVGLFRPALVVPELIRHQFSHEQLRLVLAHELVHLRRRDHWIGLVQFAAQAVWWFNPLVWWANRELNRTREQCCDEEVVSRLQCEPAGYAQTLLDILRLGPRLRPVFFASGVRALQVTEERLKHIMSDASRFHRAMPRTYWLAAILAAVLLLPGAGLALQVDEKGTTKRTESKNAQTTQANGATDIANQKPPGDEPRDKYYDHPLTVSGRALDADVKPVPNATIYLVATNISQARSLGETKTDADGRYEFRDKPLPIRVPANKDFFEEGSFQVFGKAPGRAFAWQGMKHFVVDKRGRSNSTSYLPGKPIELDLTFSEATHISGRVIDEQLNGVAGVELRLANCDYLNHAGRESHKNYREFWSISQAAKVMPEELRATTDDMGRFRFSSVPPDVICWLLVEHPKFAGLSLYTSTADDPPEVHDEHPVRKLPLLINLREVRTIPVRVVSAASGLPIPGIRVSGYQQRATGTSDYGTSDKEGNVTLRLPPGEYKVVGDPPRGESNDGFVRTYSQLSVTESRDAQPATLKMDQGCVLVLRAVDADTGKGIQGVNFWYEGDPPPGSRRGVQSSPSYVDHPKTDAKGELRAIVMSGKRRYGVGFGGLPDGYRWLGKFDHLGREFELPAGFEVVAEFKLKKEQPANVKDAQDQKRINGNSQPPAGRDEPKEAEQAKLTYFGRLTDHETDQPIEGANVTIVRYTVDLDQKEGPKETVTTQSDADGKYQFAVPRNALVGGRLFGLRLFQHPDYVGSTYAGFFSEPAKNATQRDLGSVRLAPGVTIAGRLETPDGEPAVGVPGYVLITPGKEQPSLDGSPRHKIRTGTDGRFSFNALRGSSVILSFIPDRFAPVTRDLGQQHGDIGRIRLTPGVRVSGTVQDLDGKPAAGVWVNFVMDEAVLRIRLRPDRVSRAALTNAEGEYQLDPIPPGRYRVMVQDRSWDDRHEFEHVGEPLPAAFPTTTYASSVDAGQEVLNLTAVPHVSFQVRFFDSSGKPTSGGAVLIEGAFRGQPYMIWGRLDSEGKVNAKVQRGLTNSTVMAFAQAGQSLRYRRGKDGPLEGGPRCNLGTLNEDTTDLEVIVYRRPRLTLNVVDETRKQVGNYSIRIEYASDAIQIKPGLKVRNNEPAAVRTDEGPQPARLPLYPEEAFTLIVEAEGYRPASQKLKLAEGELKEVELMLTRTGDKKNAERREGGPNAADKKR